MNASTDEIGLLAYGSLIEDPGMEIEPVIARRILTQTPFPVEYARMSQSRGGGPTVVPHANGKPVRSELLVLKPGVTLMEARNLLWRRETRQEGTDKTYPAGSSPNSVLVMDWAGFQGIGHVLYTDFPPSGKLPHPKAQALAKAAVASIAKAPLGKDGISYLMQLSGSGVETALTAEYGVELLHITGAASLTQALGWLQANRVKEELKRKLIEQAGSGPDVAGYFPRVEDNLIHGVQFRQFEEDLRAGAGRELDRKFRAVHSSSALAVNSFAPFREHPGELILMGRSGFDRLRFEKPLPTGLRGTPPHLDVWLEAENEVVAIESKLLEYFQPKKAKFEESYTRTAFPWAEDCWWAVLEDAKFAPKRHLDVAQLVKHYLGLKRFQQEEGGGTPVTLLYLFWESANATKFAGCRQHRAEVQELSRQVTSSTVSFRWLTYNQLWGQWSTVPALASHAENLKARYEASLQGEMEIKALKPIAAKQQQKPE